MTNSRTDQYGTKYWYNKNNKLHREDGPAYETLTGHKEWWINGKHHRIDGPAVEYANGEKSWYIDGKNYSKKDYLQLTRLKFAW